MKIELLVPVEVEIDEDELPGLARKANDWFESDADEASMEDVIAQAIRDGLIENPGEGWTVGFVHNETMIECEPKRKRKAKAQ